jgi:predicted outer membrane protein
MIHRIPRLVRGAMVVVVLVAVSATVYQSWAAGQPGLGGWTQTQWGPLGPADRDLLIKVRLAGLWEGPTGQQAEQMASRPEVREVGGKLATEHAQLDEIVRNAANQLGVMLPSSPTTQQVAWMNEIASKAGSDYDRTFVQIVREAHGQVLPIISEVRASTRNELVRQFAIDSAEFVNRHHQYLESTGLVDFAALPHHSPGLLGGGTDLADLGVPIILFAAMLVAAIAMLVALRKRGGSPATPRKGERITLPPPPQQHIPLPVSVPVPELAAVAAIPGPRAIDDRAIDATGPIPVITDAWGPGVTGGAGTPHWATESGATRTGARRAVNDGGAQVRVPHAGSTRTVTDSGPFRTVTDSGPLPTTDSGSYRTAAGTGSHRAATDSGPLPTTDTGSHRAAAGTGSHRAVSSTGSHRMPRRSRSRHSTRS